MANDTSIILIIPLLWLIFIIYWIVSAFFAKRSAPGTPASKGIWYRIAIFIVIVILLQWHPDGLRGFFSNTIEPFGLAGAIIGVILCAAGIVFAIWARIHLGRNWGMPMSLRKEHDLVISGPYRLVRHPIYTGILTAMLGTTLVIGSYWLIIFLFSLVYFAFAMRIEERMMMEKFPDQYPEYKKHSKKIVPFVW